MKLVDATCPVCARKFSAETPRVVCWSYLTDVRSIACFVRSAGDVIGIVKDRAVMQRVTHALADQIVKHFGAPLPAAAQPSSFRNTESTLDDVLRKSAPAPRAQRGPDDSAPS